MGAASKNSRKGKWLYFYLFVWYAAQGRFSSLFLQERGLGETEIGTLLSLNSGVGLVVNPIGAFIADNLVRRGYVYGREVVVAILSILTTVAFSLHALPKFVQPQERFLCFVIIRLIYAACQGPIYSVISGIVLKTLSDSGLSKEAFGQDRLFGAISWAIVSVLLGIAMDYQRSTDIMYTLVPITAGLLLVCIYFVTWDNSAVGATPTVAADGHAETACRCHSEDSAVHVDSTGSGGEVSSDKAENILPLPEVSSSRCCDSVREMMQVLGLLFGTSDRAMFTILCVVLSMGTSIIEDLVFLYFRNGLGASYTLCGISVVVTVIVEVPVFHYSKYILTVCGRNTLLLLACFSYVTRVVGYTFVPNGWWVLLLEPLHGVTYGCVCTAAVDHAASIAPPGLESTTQAVMGALQGGLGSLIGTSVGAYVEFTYGSHALYRGAATVVAVTTMCCAAVLTAANVNLVKSSDIKEVAEVKYEMVAFHDPDECEE